MAIWLFSGLLLSETFDQFDRVERLGNHFEVISLFVPLKQCV